MDLFGLPALFTLLALAALWLSGRTGWGRRSGPARRCAAVYLVLLVMLFLFAVGYGRVVADSEDLGFVPLLIATAPWSLACYGSLSVYFPNGYWSQLLIQFALLIVGCGGLNCCVILLIGRIFRRRKVAAQP